VEKPDFDRSISVGSAILSLYSMYLESSLQQSSQIEMFLYDKLGEDFEQLALLIRDRLNLDELLESFAVTDQQDGVGGVPVMRLLRMDGKQHPAATKRSKARAPWIAALPDQLWVRQTLLASGRT